MQLTTSTSRRLGGTFSLLASLLLVASMVFAPAALANGTTCKDLGYTKIDGASGTFSDVWGSIVWGGDGDPPTADNELRYDVNEGWQIEICLKAGNVDPTEAGPFTGPDTGSVFHDNPDLSHIGYIVTQVPVNAPAASIVEDCELGAVIVTLDNTASDEAVTYTVTFNGNATDHVVDPADDPLVLTFPVDEDTPFAVTVEAPDMDTVSAEGIFDCEEPVVNVPAASIVANCELGAVIVTLDNTASDEAVTYTVTFNGDATDHVVDPADGPLVLTFPVDEDTDYTVTVEAPDMDTVSAEGIFDCEEPPVEVEPEEPPVEVEPEEPPVEVEPEVVPPAEEEPVVEEPEVEEPVEVLPRVIEKPAADPAPEQVEVEAAVDELPATGLANTELLLLAMLLLGLGASLLLAAPGRSETDTVAA